MGTLPRANSRGSLLLCAHYIPFCAWCWPRNLVHRREIKGRHIKTFGLVHSVHSKQSWFLLGSGSLRFLSFRFGFAWSRPQEASSPSARNSQKSAFPMGTRQTSVCAKDGLGWRMGHWKILNHCALVLMCIKYVLAVPRTCVLMAVIKFLV